MFQQIQPGGGQRHGLADPLEQGHSHALFYGGHLAAQPLPQLTFAVADADARVTDASEVDVVPAFNLLHLVGDLDQALASVMQTLRPGGVLISKTACLSEMNPLIPWLALPLMRAIGKEPKVLCFDAKELEAAIARNGFLIESVERHGSKGKDIRVFIMARKPGRCDPRGRASAHLASLFHERAPGLDSIPIRRVH